MAPQLSDLNPRLPSPLEEVSDPRFSSRGLRLLLKRDDLIHPDLSGNKWRKLAPNLRAALRTNQPALLTFGGAYSNHLRATAAAGRLLRLPTVGVVRGHELADRPLNPSLARCRAEGMRLLFITRAEYRRRDEEQTIAALRERAADMFGAHFRGALPVPEGGSNAEAVRGCTTLGEELGDSAAGIDTVALACGTGGTLAGTAATGPSALGFPVLKGGFLETEVRRLQREAFGGRRGQWSLVDGFHCGGYARTTRELKAFAEDFEDQHGLAVDLVYVAKMLYGLTSLAEADAFPAGTTLAAVITGTPPTREEQDRTSPS